MKITFLRSSSASTFKMCQHLYYLEYELGIHKKPTLKMDKGTIVHKALELLASGKLAEQEGRVAFIDDALDLVAVFQVTPDWSLNVAFDHYSRLSPELPWSEADRRECRRWLDKVLLLGPNRRFDPRHREIITPEMRFDLVLDEPWAEYSYELPNGEVIQGKLGLKGTIDLIVRDREDPDILEIIDWKTGLRKDWSKDSDKKKSYEDLRDDFQLRLYHFAACRLYPQAKEIFVTIFYVNDGGPFSLCFNHEDIPQTEEIIRRTFERIKTVQVPKLRAPWYGCTRFCYFGRTRSPIVPSKTICQFFADKVRRDGIEKTTETYGVPKAYLKYGDGGGRKDAD